MAHQREDAGGAGAGQRQRAEVEGGAHHVLAPGQVQRRGHAPRRRSGRAGRRGRPAPAWARRRARSWPARRRRSGRGRAPAPTPTSSAEQERLAPNRLVAGQQPDRQRRHAQQRRRTRGSAREGVPASAPPARPRAASAAVVRGRGPLARGSSVLSRSWASCGAVSWPAAGPRLLAVQRLARARRQRHPHAVAAAELGVVDGGVGGADQAVDAVAVLGVGGHADADRGIARPRGRSARSAPPACAGTRPARARTSRSGRAAARTARRRRSGRRSRARPVTAATSSATAWSSCVAGQVAVAVVDLAQVVEVDHHDRQVGSALAGHAERVGEALREVLEVGEARLRVGARLVAQHRHPQAAVDQEHRPAASSAR